MKLRDEFCELCRINTYKAQINNKTYKLSIEYIPDNNLWKYNANWRCTEDSTKDKEAFSQYFNMAVVLESKFTNIEETKNENCHLCKNNLKITKDDDGIL